MTSENINNPQERIFTPDWMTESSSSEGAEKIGRNHSSTPLMILLDQTSQIAASEIFDLLKEKIGAAIDLGDKEVLIFQVYNALYKHLLRANVR